MVVLAFVPWPDRTTGDETGLIPGNLAKAAMGLVVGSLALWILLAAFDWRVWPTSQLWLDFLPIAGAASIVLALFRTPECAAFLTGLLGWPLALIAAVPDEPSYRTPTLEGEAAHSTDPGSAMVWGLLVCAALLPTIRYLRSAPSDSGGPQWTGLPPVLVVFLLGFATWMCWDARGLTYPLIAGAAVAAPTAMLWGRPGLEHVAALLGATTAAGPVLITVFSFRDQYSQGWSVIAAGVAVAAFALAAVTALLSNPARPARISLRRLA